MGIGLDPQLVAERKALKGMDGFGEHVEPVQNQNKADHRLSHPKVHNSLFERAQRRVGCLVGVSEEEASVIGVDHVHRKHHVAQINQIHISQDVHKKS